MDYDSDAQSMITGVSKQKLPLQHHTAFPIRRIKPHLKLQRRLSNASETSIASTQSTIGEPSSPTTSSDLAMSPATSNRQLRSTRSASVSSTSSTTATTIPYSPRQKPRPRVHFDLQQLPYRPSSPASQVSSHASSCTSSQPSSHAPPSYHTLPLSRHIDPAITNACRRKPKQPVSSTDLATTILTAAYTVPDAPDPRQIVLNNARSRPWRASLAPRLPPSIPSLPPQMPLQFPMHLPFPMQMPFPLQFPIQLPPPPPAHLWQRRQPALTYYQSQDCQQDFGQNFHQNQDFDLSYENDSCSESYHSSAQISTSDRDDAASCFSSSTLATSLDDSFSDDESEARKDSDHNGCFDLPPTPPYMTIAASQPIASKDKTDGIRETTRQSRRRSFSSVEHQLRSSSCSSTQSPCFSSPCPFTSQTQIDSRERRRNSISAVYYPDMGKDLRTHSIQKRTSHFSKPIESTTFSKESREEESQDSRLSHQENHYMVPPREPQETQAYRKHQEYMDNQEHQDILTYITPEKRNMPLESVKPNDMVENYDPIISRVLPSSIAKESIEQQLKNMKAKFDKAQQEHEDKMIQLNANLDITVARLLAAQSENDVLKSELAAHSSSEALLQYTSQQHADRARELQTDLTATKSMLEIERLEKKSLQSTLEGTEKRLADERSNMASLQSSFTATSQLLTEERGEKASLQEAHTSLQEHCADLETQVVVVRNAKTELHCLLISQINDLESTRDAIQSRIEILESEITNRDTRLAILEAAHKELESSNAVLVMKAEMAESSCQELAECKACLEEQLLALTRAVTSLEDSKASQETQIATLNAEKDALAGAADSLATDKTGLRVEIESLQQKSSDSMQQIMTLEAALHEKQQEIGRLCEVRAELKNQLADQVASHEAALADIRDEAHNATNKIVASLESTVESLTKEKESLASDLAALHNSQAVNQADLAQAHSDKLRKQHAAQEQLIHQQNEQVQQQQQQIEQLMALQQRNILLTEQLANANSQITEAQTAYASARNEISVLRGQTAKTRTRPSSSSSSSDVASTTSTSRKRAKTGKDGLVLVRNPNDRGRFQLIRRSDLHSSRSSSQSSHRSDDDADCPS